MAFSPDVKDKALVAAARHCCLCHRFCGLKIECHHIVEIAANGDDTFENCLPVCLECHADMRSYDSKHPRGTKYRPAELRLHRDAWYTKVAATGGLIVSPTHSKVDRDLFVRFRASFPWDPTFLWLKYHSFDSEFQGRMRAPLHELCQTAEDPSNEFLDAELEAARADFVLKVEKFLIDLGSVTFSCTGEGGYYSIPKDWRVSDRPYWDECVKEANAQASGIADTYSAFVRLCRRRLEVD